MAGVFFGLMIGLELKHYIADYFLQPAWMLAGNMAVGLIGAWGGPRERSRAQLAAK